MSQKVFVNRTLNLRKIKYIGLDMDHTLVRYNSKAFESLAHQSMVKKLVEQKNYPESILKLPFDFDLAIRGLVIDRKRGNLLKVSRHGAIRASFHGTKPIDFHTQQSDYKSIYIDLSESNKYSAIDTTFSISIATLFAQLVDEKDLHKDTLPDYDTIAGDLMFVLDQSHRDGSLKDVVAKNLEKFIVKDSEVVAGLERFKKHDKKIFILTNSDYSYSKMLLDFAVNPFLKEHDSWMDLFEIVVTNAQKPRFFFDNLRFLKINPTDGSMTNYEGKLTKGIYQGGGAAKFTADLGVEGDDILYIGDHIYGDILRLKKDCNWRTALVVEELETEIENAEKAHPYFDKIAELMIAKEPFEQDLVDEISKKIEFGKTKKDKRPLNPHEETITSLQNKLAELDKQISPLIKKQQSMFNANWGEVFRAGNEESYFASQVDRFACIYMARLSDLLELSPRTYFRAARRPLAHEIALKLV